MDIYSEHEKKELIKGHSPKTKVIKTSVKAFLAGGSVSLLGELLRRIYRYMGAEDERALTLVSITLILLASLLTALGIFDKIAKHTGAGTLVPITGFSNAVTSPAIDAKSEGYILGVGSKIFTVAGPVILFGLASGVLYGIIYYTVDLVLKLY